MSKLKVTFIFKSNKTYSYRNVYKFKFLRRKQAFKIWYKNAKGQKFKGCFEMWELANVVIKGEKEDAKNNNL